MFSRVRVATLLLGSVCVTFCLQARNTPTESNGLPESSLSLDQVVDRAIAREHQEVKDISSYTPVVETYIQEVRPDPKLGMVPRSDFHFFGQADLSHGVKVHSMFERSWKDWFRIWNFEPAGFVQMVFIDRQDFDRAHYVFANKRQRFLGDVRCYVVDVKAAPKARGARFVGSIWVEDKDFTIVRFSGTYTPAQDFSWKHLDDEYYFHFDSSRSHVRPGIWLPDYIYSAELGSHDPFGIPRFKSFTQFWGYQPKSGSRSEELSRVLMENPAAVKDESTQRDRSPLESLREWRHQSENNVLDLLQGKGIVSPPGPVDETLNAVVNNLEVSNNLGPEVDFRCRILLTSNLELFSIGETIVISRGLVDAVPDEATLAAFLAHGMADAMNPKTQLDQYGFSDIARLSGPEIFKWLSFRQSPLEVKENSDKAIELLKKSSYAAKMSTAGLFLKQLQSQSKALRALISSHLGNQVYFAEQLLQAAPALDPLSTTQIAALPLGSHVKIDPWSGSVTLVKPKPANLFSPRDKIPFEVVPMVSYLNRYSEPPVGQAPESTAPKPADPPAPHP